LGKRSPRLFRRRKGGNKIEWKVGTEKEVITRRGSIRGVIRKDNHSRAYEIDNWVAKWNDGFIITRRGKRGGITRSTIANSQCR